MSDESRYHISPEECFRSADRQTINSFWALTIIILARIVMSSGTFDPWDWVNHLLAIGAIAAIRYAAMIAYTNYFQQNPKIMTWLPRRSIPADITTSDLMRIQDGRLYLLNMVSVAAYVFLLVVTWTQGYRDGGAHTSSGKRMFVFLMIVASLYFMYDPVMRHKRDMRARHYVVWCDFSCLRSQIARAALEKAISHVVSQPGYQGNESPRDRACALLNEKLAGTDYTIQELTRR